MAALLAIFRHVPPLVRPRAKELMDVIRSSLEDAPATTRLPQPAAVSRNVLTERKDLLGQQNVAVPPASDTSSQKSKDSARLWRLTSSRTLAIDCIRCR